MTAFINALREEGTKEDCLAAVERLWDQLTAARIAGKIEGLKEAAYRCEMEANNDRYPMFYNQEQAHKETARLLSDAIRAKIVELNSTDSASHSSEAGYTTARPSEEPSA